ncbi:MAG: hypothetical protein N2652_03155 [Kiritimatiellae bacterium]|nr:hypothetical protein [Kiritimatiellia bacterium]
MRMDLRQMPLHELARLLRDIANELQARGNGGGRGNSIYNRATGYGAYTGNYGNAYPGGGYGAPSRFGNEFRPHSGNKRRRHHRHRHSAPGEDRRPVEPPALVDDLPPPSAPPPADPANPA